MPIKQLFRKLVSYKPSFLLFFSTLILIVMFYYWSPQSFEEYWKGRAPYLFYLWLLILETILFQKDRGIGDVSKSRSIAAYLVASIPIAYAVIGQLGLNTLIISYGQTLGLGEFAYHYWPISVEYTLFFLCITASAILLAGITGVKKHPISIFFVGTIAFFFMLDNFYPYNSLTILQLLVPTTTIAVTQMLRLLGYQASFYEVTNVIVNDNGGRRVETYPLITASNGSNEFSAFINWPCAGVQSLIIYTFTIILFLSAIKLLPLEFRLGRPLERLSCRLPERLNSSTSKITQRFPSKLKAICEKLRNLSIRISMKLNLFVSGLLVTFFVNVLRVTTIIVLAVDYNADVGLVFHNYYGQLFFLAWITIYMLFLTYLSSHLNKSITPLEKNQIFKRNEEVSRVFLTRK